MKTRTKEEITEHYGYELQEEFEWCLHNKHYEPDNIEKVLEDMYEELKPIKGGINNES